MNTNIVSQQNWFLRGYHITKIRGVEGNFNEILENFNLIYI